MNGLAMQSQNKVMAVFHFTNIQGFSELRRENKIYYPVRLTYPASVEVDGHKWRSDCKVIYPWIDLHKEP